MTEVDIDFGLIREVRHFLSSPAVIPTSFLLYPNSLLAILLFSPESPGSKPVSLSKKEGDGEEKQEGGMETEKV